MVETHFDENYSSTAVIKFTSGVWGRIPQPPETNGGGAPDAAAILQLFSPNIRIFRHIFFNILVLKWLN